MSLESGVRELLRVVHTMDEQVATDPNPNPNLDPDSAGILSSETLEYPSPRLNSTQERGNPTTLPHGFPVSARPFLSAH